MKKLLIIMSVLFLSVGGCCQFSAKAVHWLITASVVLKTPTPTPTRTPVPTPTKDPNSVFSGKAFDDLDTVIEAVIVERTAKAPAYVESIEMQVVRDPWEYPYGDEINNYAEEAKEIEIKETIHIKGVSMDNPFVKTGEYLFDYGEDGWYLDGEVDYGDRTPFWTLHTTFVDTEQFLLISNLGHEETLNAILPLAEGAYANLQAKGFTLEDKYVVYYAPDLDTFHTVRTATYTARTIEKEPPGGTANYKHTRESFNNDARPTNRAIYINGHYSEQSLDDYLEVLFEHEIVHLIMSDVSRRITPRWLVEGVAVYHTDSQIADYTHRCKESDLTELTNVDWLTSDEYNCVGLLYAYLVSAYGEDSVLTLYGRFTEVRFDDDNYAERRAKFTPRFVEEELGISMEQLEADFILSLDQE